MLQIEFTLRLGLNNQQWHGKLNSSLSRTKFIEIQKLLHLLTKYVQTWRFKTNDMYVEQIG